jgi:hypothetical protein
LPKENAFLNKRCGLEITLVCSANDVAKLRIVHDKSTTNPGDHWLAPLERPERRAPKRAQFAATQFRSK